MATIYVTAIHCPLLGEPRVFTVRVTADDPLGALDLEAYDMLGLSKKTELFHFKVEVPIICGVTLVLTT